MSVLLIDNLLYDANNFTDTGSWTQTSIAAESHTAPAPDGSLTAYNFVDSNTGSTGLIGHDIDTAVMHGKYEDIRCGMFVKNTGVNSGMLFRCQINSASIWSGGAVVWSSNGEAVLQLNGAAAQERLVQVTSDGWWLAEISFPNSGYRSDVSFYVWPGSSTGSQKGAIALWNPYVALRSGFADIEAEWNFKRIDKKIEDRVKTAIGGNTVHKWGEHSGIQFSTKYVSRQNHLNLQKWWQDRTSLLALDEYGTFVQSGTLQGGSPTTKLAYPYDDQFDGVIKLGAY